MNIKRVGSGVGGEVECVPLAGVKAKVRIRFAVLCAPHLQKPAGKERRGRLCVTSERCFGRC